MLELKQKRQQERVETYNRILSNKLKRNDKVVKDLVDAKKVLKELSLEVKAANKDLGEVVKQLDDEEKQLEEERALVESQRQDIETQFA